MGTEHDKEDILLKKLHDFAAGFYFDCSRDDLSGMIRNICATTRETHDYVKFCSAVSNVLFKKVYVEGEVWQPALITGAIDIILDIVEVDDTKSSFNPANAMSGETKIDVQNLRQQIIDLFNKHVSDSGIEEMMGGIIK